MSQSYSLYSAKAYLFETFLNNLKRLQQIAKDCFILQKTAATDDRKNRFQEERKILKYLKRFEKILKDLKRFEKI